MSQSPHSPDWRRSVVLLRTLAGLAEKGRSQGREAQAIRGAMEEFEGRLTAEEEALLDGLSADLWLLAGEDQLGPTPSEAEEVALRDAKAAGRWREVSALLGDFPRLASGADGALLRAQCWAALEEPGIAGEFADLAARLLAAQSGDLSSVAALRRPRIPFPRYPTVEGSP